jgi:hypothetical protein
MKRWAIPMIVGMVVVAAILALFLQDVIRRVVIAPLAYLWWGIKLYYSTIPQLFLWIILVVILSVVIITSLAEGISFDRKIREPLKPTPGSVESLAGWIKKIGDGNYYKWRVANRLGRLARELVTRQASQGEHPSRVKLEGSGWNPPPKVQRYLEAGLNESFVDYPRPSLAFLPQSATPFDMDVNEVVKFLESQVEASNERKHP